MINIKIMKKIYNSNNDLELLLLIIIGIILCFTLVTLTTIWSIYNIMVGRNRVIEIRRPFIYT